MLAWWGNTNFPTGDEPAPALTQQQWGGLYFLLENAALDYGAVKPLALIDAATRDLRPDGPLPIAIASFRVAVPRASLAQRVLARRPQRRAASRFAARAPGRCDRGAPRLRRDGLPARSVGSATPRCIAVATCTFSPRRGPYFTNPDAPCPTASSSTSATAQGWRSGRASATCSHAHYRRRQRRDRRALPLRRRGAQGAFDAGPISDDPAPPAARRDLAAAAPPRRRPSRAPPHDGQPGASGRAWVFRAPGRTEILNPVILVEGFPGGHPCDYMYELLNHRGRSTRCTPPATTCHRRARQRPDADPAQRQRARAVHPRGTQAHAAAARRRRREHGRDGQPLRPGVDGEAGRGRTGRART